MYFYLLDLYSMHIYHLLPHKFSVKNNTTIKETVGVNILEFSLAWDKDDELKLSKLEPDILR